MQTKMILRPLPTSFHSNAFNSSHYKFGVWQNSEVAWQNDLTKTSRLIVNLLVRLFCKKARELVMVIGLSGVQFRE